MPPGPPLPESTKSAAAGDGDGRSCLTAVTVVEEEAGVGVTGLGNAAVSAVTGAAAAAAALNVAWLLSSGCQQDVVRAATAACSAALLLLIEDDVEQVDEAMFLGLLELEEAFS